MTTINDELRLREGDTNQTYGKLHVDSSKDLHFVDSEGNDTNLTDGGDGYINAIRSIFVDSTTGSFDYDTNPAPGYKQSNIYWQAAYLDGSYSSGVYQEFRSQSFQVPLDYASGGILKMYGFLDETSGDVWFEETTCNGVRIGDSSQSLSLFGASNNNLTVTADQEAVVTFSEIDLGGGNFTGAPLQPGDIMMVRVQRRAGHANDTASTGDFCILGFEFFYNANIPKQTY